MQPIFEDYLFSHGYFVADAPSGASPEAEAIAEHAAEALAALAHFAAIRITAHPERANLDMLRIAQRNLGSDVPEAFYRGFPASVRDLSIAELLLDQLLHYFRTYGCGDFSEAGHSLFEEVYERAEFTEEVEPKDFAIITQDEAEALLMRMAEGFLASTRPLNDANYQLLRSYLGTHPGFTVERCASKDTAVRLIIDTNDAALARLITMPDVIRLVEWLLELHYEGASIRKLNLKNRHRKLIAAVLDRLFERGDIDTAACLEKKRIWCGLLHHLHYQPKGAEAEAFCRAMRTKDQRSVYAAMERCLDAGDVRGAVDVLRAEKGAGAVLRRFDYLLSRSVFDAHADQPDHVIDEDIAYILDACDTRNKIILVQLLLKYSASLFPPKGGAARTFTFVRLGKLRKHTETEKEYSHRRTQLFEAFSEYLSIWLLGRLEDTCRGTLGKVYIADGLRNAALPLQEGASMGGFGTLPRGTRIPLPDYKKIRAFTYWEKVDDIDLSCFALDDNGNTAEFSWRNMAARQSPGILFSGDQTAGFDGGSEYFDIDIAQFREERGSQWHYLVFCNNVYSSDTFDRCVCRAGYMLRDIDDTGEVFEPATVQTSFIVNCSSRAAYLFALDLHDPALIWLNLGESSMARVAGNGDVSFLARYLHTVDIINLHDFARMLAAEVVTSPAEADVVFSDDPPELLALRDDQELIRPRDTARLLELLN